MDVAGLFFSGTFAWFVWLVHLMAIVGFKTGWQTLLQWFSNYINFNSAKADYQALSTKEIKHGQDKNRLFCKNCGNESAKWIGKCPGCGEWNTYVEETVVTGKKPKRFLIILYRPNRQNLAGTRDQQHKGGSHGYGPCRAKQGAGWRIGSRLVGFDRRRTRYWKINIDAAGGMQLNDVKVLYISGRRKSAAA